MKLDCSTLPIVRLGQGDYVTDIWPRDIVGRNADESKPDITSVLIRETADVYHARRGECLTSHRLAEFRRCPMLFRWKELGLAPERNSAAYALGRAAHVLI
ncbi:MAG: hypothetical protein C0511_19315, partial [Hyphomicrobium sp.]|nr:hypothetical protein [Hyphomicrobium sp.]